MQQLGVLGANGFIGTRIVESLHLSRLATVIPIVRRVDGLASLARFDLSSRIANANDKSALTAAFLGCDIVIHTIAGDRDTIVGSIKPVFHAAEAAGVKRLIYLSSASVHGQAPAIGTNENSVLSARQSIAYNNYKVEAEQKLLNLHQKSELELVILRPGIVFGPRSLWVRQFASDLINGSAYLVDRGQGICNSIYVDNLIHAILCAIKSPSANGQSFLVGDKERISWADFYRPVAESLGFKLEDIPEALPMIDKTSFADRIEAVLGSDLSLAVLSLFPDAWRRTARSRLNSLLINEFTAPTQPMASLEMTLLQQCQYKFPNTKAQQMLKYDPPIKFADAMRLTISWLKFSGYPVRNCLTNSAEKAATA